MCTQTYLVHKNFGPSKYKKMLVNIKIVLQLAEMSIFIQNEILPLNF
jgi:hypothetical protein